MIDNLGCYEDECMMKMSFEKALFYKWQRITQEQQNGIRLVVV